MSSLKRAALVTVWIFALACDGDRIPVDPDLAASRAPAVKDFPINDELDLPCDGVTLHVSYAGSGRATTYFNDAGDPVRLLIRTTVQGSAVNTSTGRTLTDNETIVIVIDLVTGETTINGAPAHVTAPGEGIVIHDTGRIVFDANGNVTFEAGAHDQADQDPLQVYCSALG
jgi:hypothetical protein